MAPLHQSNGMGKQKQATLHPFAFRRRPAAVERCFWV